MLVIMQLLDLRLEATDLGGMRLFAPEIERWVELALGTCGLARITRRFRWFASTTAL